ncbi:hypothetical protein M413DRAFT_18086 [Hebeloma cylindrosporum]|uniref:Uncharacterized protein n=1 Tax=Hebeloma cylindrosporum TaxID=76867 RepID=A0A0C3CJ01_HEBCY|nr:hypothetical protein M413DRAFT_18086 [Hebeloma cylindrosporum h7]
MLYIQITQVLIRRPKRGRTFWFIIVYSTTLFPLATFAFVGKFTFKESMYVNQSGFSGDARAYAIENAGDWSNIMSQVGTESLIIKQLYRLMVLWNCKWSLLLVPAFLYLARVAVSIPLLISHTHPTFLQPRAEVLEVVFHSLCFTLNFVFTSLIAIRIYMLRHKAEMVLGRLQASLYNSAITMFVESGAFFTIWSFAYLITLVRDCWIQDILLQPYSYIIALTRMLIVLRMAQDRAWSTDIINAADNGVLDWQVSSINSLSHSNQLEQKLPRKLNTWQAMRQLRREKRNT